MFDITKWFENEKQIDVNVLQSMEKNELLKTAKENKIDVDEKAEKNVIIEAIKKFVEQKRLEDKPPEDKPVKTYKYLCKEDCVYLGKYRREGDIIHLPENKKVPHFELVEDKKE